MQRIRPSTRPGIILKEEFTNPLGITLLMALKLSKYFGTTPQFWLNFQNAYDLHKAYSKEKENLKKITKKWLNPEVTPSLHVRIFHYPKRSYYAVSLYAKSNRTTYDYRREWSYRFG